MWEKTVVVEVWIAILFISMHIAANGQKNSRCSHCCPSMKFKFIEYIFQCHSKIKYNFFFVIKRTANVVVVVFFANQKLYDRKKFKQANKERETDSEKWIKRINFVNKETANKIEIYIQNYKMRGQSKKEVKEKKISKRMVVC